MLYHKYHKIPRQLKQFIHRRNKNFSKN